MEPAVPPDLSVGLDLRQCITVLALLNCGTGRWEGPGKEKPGTQALRDHNSIIRLLGAIANELRLRAPLTSLYCGSGGNAIMSLCVQRITSVRYLYLPSF